MSEKKLPYKEGLDNNDIEEEKRKIKREVKTSKIKFYYGNPEN